LAYPLDRALGYGNVRVLSLLGARVKKREYCGDCMKKIGALVESVLIIAHRLGGGNAIFPKVLIDMIVLNALENLRGTEH
jgi:hypothetical protein